MEFQRMYGKRKKSNPKRGIILIILLILVLVIWFNAETLIEKFL